MQSMATTHIGQRAEQAAAVFLKNQGFTVLDRNWRRRDCEIDIVARKSSAVYFVEVKYRSDDDNGGGLDYITTKKIKRMAYAASRWVAEEGWLGEYCLAAIELSGNYQVDCFIDNLT
jgi:putative endonuclease